MTGTLLTKDRALIHKRHKGKMKVEGELEECICNLRNAKVCQKHGMESSW
jgi:hypothetical protein